MSADVFIDTNVFTYHLDATHPGKHAVAEQVVRRSMSERNACISFQVVQECLNTVQRKSEVPLDEAGARSYLDVVLAPLLQVPPWWLCINGPWKCHNGRVSASTIP